MHQLLSLSPGSVSSGEECYRCAVPRDKNTRVTFAKRIGIAVTVFFFFLLNINSFGVDYGRFKKKPNIQYFLRRYYSPNG